VSSYKLGEGVKFEGYARQIRCKAVIIHD